MLACTFFSYYPIGSGGVDLKYIIYEENFLGSYFINRICFLIKRSNFIKHSLSNNVYRNCYYHPCNDTMI